MKNLIELNEFKESEGLSNNEDDLRLGSLIESVSQLVKTYCGYSLVDYYDTERTDSFNVKPYTKSLLLKEFPVIGIVKVEQRWNMDESYETVPPSDYYLDYDTDMLIKPKYWPHGPGAVKVEYTAGYQTTPLDLKLAVIDLINYYHRDEHKERQTLMSASRENPGTSSINTLVGFPDHIKRVLDLYKMQ